MLKMLKMGASPHIRVKQTADDVMYDVIIALIPTFLVACYFFGIKAFVLTSVSIISCMLTEFVCQKMMKREVLIFDGSAIITGILLAFILPPDISLIYVAIGAAVAIGLGKMVYGGLGQNIFNPAIVGRGFIQVSWPVAITTFAYDGIGGATILDAMKRGLPLDGILIEQGNIYLNTFLGKMGGSLGETSVLAILLGGLYLIYKKHIDWEIPTIIIGVVFVGAFIAGANPVLHIFSGGLFLGAFFMATDMVTSPHTKKGKMVFAFFIGLLVVLIRFKGGYPEGVAYSIFIMNGFVPLINKYIRPKVAFGGAK